MKILIIDILCTPFEEKQINLLGKVFPINEHTQIQFKVVHLNSERINLNELEDFDKVIISGSFMAAYSDFEWKQQLRDIIDKLIEENIPTYAICFGAQFVAMHLGAKVHLNPRGIEFGVIKINLTEAGKNHPILKDYQLGQELHASHRDVIEDVPEGAVLLAYNEMAPVQAFQYKNIFATQFHTDFPVYMMEKLLELRKEEYLAKGILKDLEHYHQTKNSLPRGEAAHQLLHKFLLD